jgi:hypothetical protein
MDALMRPRLSVCVSLLQRLTVEEWELEFEANGAARGKM